MDENWVLVYSSSDEKLCKKAKSFLKEEKIVSTIENKKDGNVFIGEYELFVKMEDLGKSRSLLKGFNIE